MKIEILKEYIRKTVKEEIKNVLKEELRYQLTEIFLSGGVGGKISNSSSKPKKTFIEKSEEKTQQISENKVASTKNKIRYTTNEVFNDILNETTCKIPSEDNMVGMMGGGFDKIGGGEDSMLMESSDIQPPPEASEPVKKVFNAMNRDYRSLLKAVDKKQGKV